MKIPVHSSFQRAKKHLISTQLVVLQILLVFGLQGDCKSYSIHPTSRHSLLSFTDEDFTECSILRWRKEIRALTPGELESFRNAMSELVFARPSTNYDYFPPPSMWDTFVAAHIAHMDEAHNGAYFLPWHRLFTLTVENEIRQKIDEDFTMPYWDWTVDADDLGRSSIFTSTYLGSSIPSRPFSDGPFVNLSSIYPRERPVARGFDSSASNDVFNRHGLPMMNRTELKRIQKLTDWFSFADQLEKAHDIVHTAIGGTLESFSYSPNDPLFYLIHSFVDKVWAERQMNSKTPFEFHGSHRIHGQQEQAKRSHVMELFGKSVDYSIRLGCIRYEPYRECEDD